MVQRPNTCTKLVISVLPRPVDRILIVAESVAAQRCLRSSRNVLLGYWGQRGASPGRRMAGCACG